MLSKIEERRGTADVLSLLFFRRKIMAMVYGYTGVAFLFLSFWLISTDRIKNGVFYQSLNLIGNTCLLGVNWAVYMYPNMIINIAFGLISIYYISKYLSGETSKEEIKDDQFFRINKE